MTIYQRLILHWLSRTVPDLNTLELKGLFLHTGGETQDRRRKSANWASGWTESAPIVTVSDLSRTKKKVFLQDDQKRK